MSTRIERAAGGLVFRKGKRGIEVLMIHDAYGKITFPKGHLEVGESWEDAALREVEEETGISSRLITPIGRVEYPVVRNNTQIRKQVRLYLLEAIDEEDEPQHQAEEIEDAFYVNIDEAKRLHDESGYANWAWIFTKAQALWDWHEGKWESRWRALEAKASLSEVLQEWQAVEPIVKRMIESVHMELASTAEETVCNWENELNEVRLPLDKDFTSDEIRQAVEHTRLNPEASEVDIENLCMQAQTHRFPLVCVSPRHVALASSIVRETGTCVCTVLGFPHGAHGSEVLCTELRKAVADGASEVDMVIPIGAMLEDDVWTVHESIHAVVTHADQIPQRPCVKVIIEASALRFDQLVKASMIAISAGADFVKTSTGFHKRGAAIADVVAMRFVAGTKRGVKASGGVRTKAEAQLFLRFGANRIGTSSGVGMVR